MHLAPLIFDLAIILAVAGLMSFLFQKIKQPVVLGYIMAGVIVGPHTPPVHLVKDLQGIQTWAELGVIFLMFTLGLEFSFRKLLSVGVTAGVSAGFEVAFFLVVGYGIGQALGWTSMDSIFLGAMLSISSTTIIIKALDELKLKTHRFASLIFGVLIVEDLIAILLLVGLTTVASTQTFSPMALLSAGLNLFLVVGGWFITGYFLIPRLMAYLGRTGNSEMLTLISIGLCLLLVVLAAHLGYSPALGAFIMGSILAETKIIHQIEGLMAPLRDLFGAIFFVSIGMLIDPHILWEHKGTVLLLSLVTVFGKIGATSFGALASGQTFKNSIQVGMGLAQIGEFSFIIASLGVTLKATSNILYPIAVAVSLLTTFTTPYFIKYSGPAAQKLEDLLPSKWKKSLDEYATWWEHKKTSEAGSKELFLILARWLMNGIVVTLIFNTSFKTFATRFQFTGLTWLITLALASPFIWGMVFISQENYAKIRKEKDMLKAMLVFSFPVLTAIWVGILSTRHFPVKYVLPTTILLLLVVYFSLYKKFEFYYQWLESTFLKTFEKEAKPKTQNLKLAPWDSHLVNIEVHPNAILVNHSLLTANLRQRFGVNVVAIKRGVQTIIAPKPSEVIFPGDTLVMLGTDMQLDEARPELEIPENIAALFPNDANYRLRHLKLRPESPIVGKTVRHSGIREKFHAMVVGIERKENRIINPDTDFLLREEDIIWVVGEESMLASLFQELA